MVLIFLESSRCLYNGCLTIEKEHCTLERQITRRCSGEQLKYEASLNAFIIVAKKRRWIGLIRLPSLSGEELSDIRVSSTLHRNVESSTWLPFDERISCADRIGWL